GLADNETFLVQRGDIVRTIIISGELQAEQSREINCPRIRSGFSSTITFMADEGINVRQGDRVLEFDSSDLVSSKGEAERKLDEAKLQIAKTSADLAATRCDLENALAQAEGQLKIARLYGGIPKELIPDNDYERYQMELERAQLALEKATEQLQNHDASVPAQLGLVEVQRAQAELELRRIETDLGMLEINAPQNGIVIYGDNWRENRKIQVGDAIFPGMTVMSLPDLTSMRITGYVYDTELRYLRPGAAANFGLVAIPGKTWTGRITSLTSVAGRKGFASDHKVFSATIDLDQQDTAYRPGMTARVEIPVNLASDVLTIPRTLLGSDSDGSYFVVVSQGKGNEPLRQTVEIGAHGSEVVEVTTGLEGGDELVGLNRLGGGQK
ncbi:MAG: efflux RND transporter periplasmic adaptor subunit, partial [Acidobacteriota bacterium]